MPKKLPSTKSAAKPARGAPPLLADVLGLILAAREGIARTVNAGLTQLYWEIGNRIRKDVLKEKRAEYGEQIVSALSAQLSKEFGRGFSKRNLFNMVRFAEAFMDKRLSPHCGDNWFSAAPPENLPMSTLDHPSPRIAGRPSDGWFRPVFFVGLLLAAVFPIHALDDLAKDRSPKPIAPAVSTGTGLLLEPALTLPEFTRETFAAAMATVGPEKIQRPWTNPVVTLPPHPRAEVKGLTEAEVKAYMTEAKRLFNRGESVPLSDVGLISTQEDVIRKPMLNHIAAFSNSVARVYLLVQKTSTDTGWSYFSIVQDLTLTPVLDYFAELKKEGPKFEGTSCYKCHSSGPLAIHPAREDLVLDAPLAAAIGRHIAEQPRSRFFFPADSPKPDPGKPLTLKFCARCHAEDGDRDVLHQVHSHPIRVLVDFGYMPPNRRLKPEEIAELKAWLEHKP